MRVLRNWEKGFVKAIIDRGVSKSKDDLPCKPCVFVLFNGDAIQYIGKSPCLHFRLRKWEFKVGPKNEKIPFDRCEWYRIVDSLVVSAYDYLVSYYEPPFK